MRWVTIVRAEPNERFAPTSWDGVIGKPFPFTTPGHTQEAILLAAVVAKDGTSVELTFEAPQFPRGFEDGSSVGLTINNSPLSAGFLP
uniref:hypothetical protein n=1 Tax=Streptosporangium sp. CA-235898 TaxID=3240073 RepID=UPI003F491BF8